MTVHVTSENEHEEKKDRSKRQEQKKERKGWYNRYQIRGHRYSFGWRPSQLGWKKEEKEKESKGHRYLEQGRYEGLLTVLVGARTLLGAPGIAIRNKGLWERKVLTRKKDVNARYDSLRLQTRDHGL